MDARLTAAGLIAKRVIGIHDFTVGQIDVPWFGARKMTDVIFERDRLEQPPNERQIDAFCRFLAKRDEFFATLEGTLFQYYNRLRETPSFDQDPIARLWPHLATQQQLGSFINLTGVLVSHYDGEPWCDYIGLLMECTWEKEHGLGAKVVDGMVTEIGDQGIVL